MSGIESATMVFLVQSTMFSLVLLVVYLFALVPLGVSRKAILTVGLFVLMTVSLCSFLPVSGWSWMRSNSMNRVAVREFADTTPQLGSELSNRTLTDESISVDRPGVIETGERQNEWSAAGFLAALTSVQPPLSEADKGSIESASGKSVRTFLTWIVCGAFALGLFRLLAGWLALQRVLRQSPIVDCDQSKAMVSELCERLGCRNKIDLRQNGSIDTAATFGSRRPIIILPTDFIDWDDQQLESVLAHEIAHIASNDFAQHVLGQFCAAIHFCNPLVHWLASLLRIEQEIDADHRAAKAVGDRAAYLKTLALLALQQDTRNRRKFPGGLAPMFLPTRKTLVRRVEMLRRIKHPLRHSFVMTLIATVGLALGGIAVAGIRTACPVEQESTQPAASIGSGVATDGQDPVPKASLSVVPASAEFAIVIRVAEMRKNPDLKGFFEVLEQKGQIEDLNRELKLRMGVTLEEIDQLTFFSDLGNTAAFACRTIEDSRDKFATLTKGNPAVGISGDISIFKIDGMHVIIASERDIVFCGSKDLAASVAGSLGAGTDSKLVSKWQPWSERTISFCSTRSLIDAFSPAAIDEQTGGAFNPLLYHPATVSGGIDFSKKMTIDFSLGCNSDRNAAEVTETLAAVIPLLKNTLNQPGVLDAGMNNPPVELLQVARKLVASAGIEQAGQQVNVNMSAEIAGGASAAMLVDSVIRVRAQATRISRMNQFRQIALAMHNYESANHHFPPAVVQGENGTRHSWRIALLPYLGANELYDAYRFDLPWDSDHNSNVTRVMPEFFRLAGQPLDLTSSSIEVFDGRECIFNGTNKTKIMDIPDGTSNTILLVEGSTGRHWAEPGGIKFEPKNAADVLKSIAGDSGETLIVAFADGSVRQIPADFDEKLFSGLIDKDDGTFIDLKVLQKFVPGKIGTNDRKDW